jgi:hypothetical protein
MRTSAFWLAAFKKVDKMRKGPKALALLCTAAFTCAGALSSAIAGSTIPGWPAYIAMGGIGGPDGPSATSVTSLSCSTAQGTGNDDFQGAPVDVIFSYAGSNGAGDAGIMVPPFKAMAMTGDLTTLSNCANNKRASRVALVEYTAEYSGGESTGLNDLTDSPNPSTAYPNGNYIMARHFVSLGADAMALNSGVAACAGALTGPGVAACISTAATGGPVTYNGSNYYGTLILNPDLLGTVQQGGAGWLTDANNVLSNNTNNPVNPGTGMAPGGVNKAVSIALCLLTTSRSYTNTYNPNGQAVGTVAYDTTYTGTPVAIMEQMLADGYPAYSLNNSGGDEYWAYSADNNYSNSSGSGPSQVAVWFNQCVSNPVSSYTPPTFPNTLDGWIQANNYIIRTVSPKGNVTFGWQEDMYAAGGNGDFWMQTQLTNSQVATAYSTPVSNWLAANAPDAISNGNGGAAYVPDYFVFDRYGEDDSNAGAYTSGATLYNAQSWDNYLTGIGQISANFNNIPIMMWQIPGSHIPNTTESNPETYSGTYIFSTAPVYFFGDSNLTSDLSNIIAGPASNTSTNPTTVNPPSIAVGNFDIAGAGYCNSNDYNCPSDSSPYYYSQWLLYYQGSANNYNWSKNNGKLAMAAANNVFAILWGAGGQAGNVVANQDVSPDNDHGWLANKIINYYTNPTSLSGSEFALGVTISGSGSVASSPSGISCTSTCSANFGSGAQVTLTASAASGSVFSGWSGACSGTGQCNVTVSAATNVTATFATQSSHTLTVNVSGSGMVTSSPSGISCGTSCSASFASGAQVTLTRPSGADFSGWSGACSGTGSCVVTMNATESVTATFAEPATLSISVTGGGTVTSNPSGISCGSTCIANYGSGTQVTLGTTPPSSPSGYVFQEWGGACSGYGSCMVTMSTGIDVSATFGYPLLTRTFVSSSGVDSNPCTLAQPCATFAQAYKTTLQKGIVAALDPGKYGPLTITGPITINGNGWSAITAPAQGNGITINAGSGNVTLTGLEIDGANAGYNGIVFNTGGNLLIDNCIVKDFIIGFGGTGNSGSGIWIAPTTGTLNFAIVNTIAVNNGYAGILYGLPSGSVAASGVIDHVVVTNNPGRGIDVDMLDGTGGSATVTISNSVANNNGRSGIVASGSSYTVTLDHDEISNNATGVNVGANTSVLLSRSVITKNTNNGVSNSGTASSSTDNRIYGNGTNISGNALTDVSPQ